MTTATNEEVQAVLDFETTGLNPAEDRILECGVMIIDPKTLEVKATKSWLVDHAYYPMEPFVREMHSNNGLLDAIAKEKDVLPSNDHLDAALSSFLHEHGAIAAEKGGNVVLVGNSIGQFDREFIRQQLHSTYSLLHHRVIDVSTLRQCYERWVGTFELNRAHRALEDCKMSLGTLRRIASERFGADTFRAVMKDIREASDAQFKLIPPGDPREYDNSEPEEHDDEPESFNGTPVEMDFTK